jgi:hypothetical protein
VIVPKGTSIVGLDLRKTKVKPLYVPDPENNSVGRSAIFDGILYPPGPGLGVPLIGSR